MTMSSGSRLSHILPLHFLDWLREPTFLIEDPYITSYRSSVRYIQLPERIDLAKGTVNDYRTPYGTPHVPYRTEELPARSQSSYS